MKFALSPRILVGIFLVLAIAAPLVLPAFHITLMNYIGLYALVALGLVLLTGVGGLTSFGQAAFVGLGAYTTAVLTTQFHASPWLGLLAGIVITLGVAFILGALTLRLSGHYLPLGTIAWGISLYFLFGTMETLGGHTGLSGIPPISIFGWALDEGQEIFYLILFFLLLAMLATSNLLDSREGRAIRALKGGRVMAEAMGVNTLRSRMTIFLIAALFACVSGWLYDTIAKFLFTSGSTGVPKAVINTQRMLCSNQQAKAQAWPFLKTEKPVLVDWLPWSHTFGSNHNFNMVLSWGGSLYLDEGKPVPGLLAKTVKNLREVSPTVYFSVPRAYDMLIPLLREDQTLRENFFRNLRYIFYAGAALPQHLWTAMQELAATVPGCETMLVSSWGSTETAPMATDCHFQAERSGVVGVPVPGTTLKLVPNAGKLEVRVKGPNVFPGYWKNPEATEKAFDADGFYLIGDAMKFVDPKRPELGLLFDGRVSEDFKLLTGTWVHVGAIRVAGIDALKPVAQDIVVTGHDRSTVGFLVFPNVPECRRLCPDLPADATVEDVLAHPAVRTCVAQGLRSMRANGSGSSMFASNALLMAEPPSVEAGEITDKGYLNQRLVLNRRAHLVNALYAEQPEQTVIQLTLEG